MLVGRVKVDMIHRSTRLEVERWYALVRRWRIIDSLVRRLRISPTTGTTQPIREALEVDTILKVLATAPPMV